MLIDRESPSQGRWDYPGGWWSELVDVGWSLIQQDLYALLAETCVAPVQIFEAGKLVPIAFPNQAYKYSFQERDHWTALAKLALMARRVRAHLAFLLGCEVPLRYAFVGDRTFMPQTFVGGPSTGGSFRMVGPALFQVQERNAALQQTAFRLKMMDVLLEQFDPVSSLNRAIVHVGEAVCASDPLDVLFHCWRAIEVITAERTSVARHSRASDEGSRPGSRTRVSGPQMEHNESQVAKTVRDLISLDISGEVSRWNECRDAVAHARDLPTHARYASLNHSRLLAVGFWTTWAVVAERVPEVASLFDSKQAAKIIPIQIEPEADPDLTERIRSSLREHYNRNRLTTESGRSD